MPEAQTERLPLVIGVTGHRDLRDQDVPELEAATAAIIARLRRDYLGNDGETPLVVLSALAEGADRLVARVALAHGARLVAPMPMPVDEYRRDFEPGLKPGNAAEFDALLAQAITAPVMPFTPGNSLEAVRDDRQKRNEQYRAVGLFITQHCHVLLALWDGDDGDRAAGGTAEVVSFKRDGIPLIVSGSPRASLDASEIGPVLHIVTPRNKASSQPDKVAVMAWGRDIIKRHRGGPLRRFLTHFTGSVAEVFRLERKGGRRGPSAEARREFEAWDRFGALIALTRQFNREAAQLVRGGDGAKRIADNIDGLFIDQDTKAVDAGARAHALATTSRWCNLYAITDALARDRQLQFKWDWQALFSIGYLAFFCFAISSDVGNAQNLVLAAYSLCFVALGILYARARIGRHQQRYLDYRALAEALRVAVYWKLLGIGSRGSDGAAGPAGRHTGIDISPIGALAGAYPIKQPNELVWVKVCLHTLERLGPRDGAAAGTLDPAGHAIARRSWVRGQFEYFKRQGLRHSGRAKALEAFVTTIIVISPFVLVPLLISGLMPTTFALDRIALILVGVSAGVAAALTGYSEKLAFSAQARQYERMRMLFERALDLLPEQLDADTAPLAYALYSELGTEAMKENAEWVAIYRQRPVHPLH
jgi:hypothetical protein